MREGVCPRCGDDEIYGAANGLGIGGSTRATIYPHLEPGQMGFRVPHRTRDLFQYLCAGCGYVEIRLLDGEAIDFVRANWVRVVKRS